MDPKTHMHEKRGTDIVIRGGNNHIKDGIYIRLPKEKLVEMGFLKEGEEPNSNTASKVQDALKIDVRKEDGDQFGPDYFLELSIGDIKKEYPMETYWYSTSFGSPSRFASWLRNTHLAIRPEDSLWEKGEGHEAGWSKGRIVTSPYADDPANKYIRKYIGRSLWGYFDDLVDHLSYADAKIRVPARYQDAFDDYAVYYGIKESNEAAERPDTRQIQAAARSAWSASGATAFRLDIVRLGDEAIIYTKSTDGDKTVEEQWTVRIPYPTINRLEKITVEHYPAHAKEPDTVAEVDTLDDLEKYLTDEFKAYQERLSGGTAPKQEDGSATVGNADAKTAVQTALQAVGPKLFKCDINDDLVHSGIDVYPKTMDGELCGVSWRILPDAGVIGRYADNRKNGTSEIVDELPFKTAADIETIFKDEFASLDETLQISLENGGW